MPIPIGNEYHATDRLQVTQEFVCESCGTEFSHQFEVIGKGDGISPLWLRNEQAEYDAENTARWDAKRRAKKMLPPHPCPTCGHIQRAMVRHYQKNRFKNAYIVSLFVIGLVLLNAAIWAIGGSVQEVIESAWFWRALAIPSICLAGVLLVRKLGAPKAKGQPPT